MSVVYEPREDSFLLAEFVRKYSKGRVLDMGTGSGYLAKLATKKADEVWAVDIDIEAVKAANKLLKDRAKVVHSDLFSKIPKKEFDLIIFNAPYLPQEGKKRDLATEGGRKGHETAVRFLKHAGPYLKKDGVILLLFSSHTGKAVVDGAIRQFGFVAKRIAEKPLFMERLFVYEIKKSKLLRELNSRGLTEVAKFDKGKRGIIYIGKLMGRKVGIKVKRPGSRAGGRIANEAKWLGRLNRVGVGPKLVHFTDEFLIYRFVEGDFVHDFLRRSAKRRILIMLRDVLLQCLLMDKMLVTKEEMNRPHHHLIVGTKPVLIDFERSHSSRRPKNVTQFCQFLISTDVGGLLEAKKISIDRQKLIAEAKTYKDKPTDKNFQRIVALLK